MIEPDAKCVVNGSKLNETIIALNPLLNMDIVIGNVTEPQIQYSEGAVQIVIPPGGGGGSTNEQLDIVDTNNQASTRWFLTTTSQGSASPGDTATAGGVNIGSIGNKSNPSKQSKDRDKLGGGGAAGGGGAGKNRDKLDRIDGGGNGVNVNEGDVGGPKKPAGGGAFGGGTDAFGNELYADGNRVTPGGMGGDLADDGLTAAQAGAQFRAGTGGDLPPLPGAPPQPASEPTTRSRGDIPPPLVGAPPLTDARTSAKSGSGTPGGFSESVRRMNERRARRNTRSRTADRLAETQRVKRQAEADKMAFANRNS